MVENFKENSSLSSGVDQSFQLLGAFRIWTNIVVGIFVVIACVGGITWTFIYDSNYEGVTAKAEEVKCSEPVKKVKCKTQKNESSCTTSEEITCQVNVTYEVRGEEHSSKFSKTYTALNEPVKGDNLKLYVDKRDASNIKIAILTLQERTTIRIVLGLVGVIAFIVVVVNLTLRKNSNFKRLEGGLGAINAVGAALKS